MNIKFLIITLVYLCVLLFIHYQIKNFTKSKETMTHVPNHIPQSPPKLDTVISMEDISQITPESIPLDLDKYFTENKMDFTFEDISPGTIPGTIPGTTNHETKEDLIDGFDDFSASFANI